MGGVSWAKWLCKLERPGLGQRFGREKHIGVGASGISHRHHRYQISVSSISVIGVGIVDIVHSLEPYQGSKQSFFIETLGWGGSAGRSGFASLSVKGLGSASAGNRYHRYRRSVSSISDIGIGIIDAEDRYRRYRISASAHIR